MEKQARKLAEAQMKLKAIEKDILDIMKEQRTEVTRLQQVSSGDKITQQMMLLSDGYRAELKRRLNRKKHELRDCENRMREEREKLIEKEKRRQVMEKVREKDLEAFAEEQRKDETKLMDEMSSVLWQRMGGDDPVEPDGSATGED